MPIHTEFSFTLSIFITFEGGFVPEWRLLSELISLHTPLKSISWYRVYMDQLRLLIVCMTINNSHWRRQRESFDSLCPDLSPLRMALFRDRALNWFPFPCWKMKIDTFQLSISIIDCMPIHNEDDNERILVDFVHISHLWVAWYQSDALSLNWFHFTRPWKV